MTAKHIPKRVLRTMNKNGLLEPTAVMDEQRKRRIAYVVRNAETGRYSLVTLDGRWIIPQPRGYVTHTRAAQWARENATDLLLHPRLFLLK